MLWPEPSGILSMTATAARNWIRLARQHPSALLLAVQLLGMLLYLPSVTLSIFAALSGRADLVAVIHLLEGMLYLYAAFGLIAYMLRDHRVSLDELFAAGATFTLLAWAFAYSYSVCQQWFPGSFIAAVEPDAPRTWMELLFLSFSTLSGVGLSDIIPIRPQARALVMLEQFAGVMYIALVVSRLIGLTVLRAPPRRE